MKKNWEDTRAGSFKITQTNGEWLLVDPKKD